MTDAQTKIRPAFLFGAERTPLVPIALGAMLMGTRTPETEARRILDHYLGEVTPRFAAEDGAPARAMIDTADCYCWWEVPGEYGGHSESLLGRWLADTGVRDSVYLATKGTATLTHLDGAWNDDGTANWDVARTRFVGASRPVLERSLAGSLERLGVDRVDLYYAHVDDPKTPLDLSIGTFADFVRQGRIGDYGWSNVTTDRLREVLAVATSRGWPRPAALQQQHSYLRRRPGVQNDSIVDGRQIELLRARRDLQLVAYSPVLRGLYSDHTRRSGDFGMMGSYVGPDADARFAAVDSVAARTGATGNQVVLAWMVASASPRVLPLIGARTFDQYLECIEALDVELTDEMLEELDAAGVPGAFA